MPRERRRQTPAAYGADYTRNLRWGYRPEYGAGSAQEPYRGGGSFGRGYGRAGYAGPHNPATPSDLEYRVERRRRERRRWPGTAARDYDRAYPYFGSAAAVEAAQGYPPDDTLTPETYPRRAWRPAWNYGEDYW